MRIVPGDEDVGRFATQAITNPLRRIFGLQISRRAEGRQRITGTPEFLGRLSRSKLPAVPDDFGARTSSRGRSGQLHYRFAPRRRQWAARIDFGSDRFTVVHQIKIHELVPGFIRHGIGAIARDSRARQIGRAHV